MRPASTTPFDFGHRPATIFVYTKHEAIMADPSPTWYIALVIVQHEGKFCLVHEKKDRGWYLPAGRVDPGETLQDGARREVLEESGLEVAFEGAPYPA